MQQSLHPFVACAPFAGLIVLVVVHILLTHASRGTMHLLSLALGFAAALLGAEGLTFAGVRGMYFFPGESPFPLYLSVAVALAGLGYGYFTFVNLNTTSLRIRLLRELWHAKDKSIPSGALLTQYDAKAITDARLGRLVAWRQIDIGPAGIALRKHAFWILSGTIQVVRGILLPPRRLRAMARSIGANSKALRQRRLLCGFLYLLIGASLLYFYRNGVACKLDRDVTERPRYHAIPVALAQIFHDAPHDYTSFNVIAMPFQGTESISGLMKKASHHLLAPDEHETYFWLADDRGYSDFVNLSFRMFGVSIKGLYQGFFCLIALSVLLAVLTFYRDPVGLSMLALFVCSYGSYLPELYSASTISGLTNFRFHLSESRTVEIIGLVFVIQIIGVIVRSSRFNVLTLAGVAGQALLLGFLFSCRSSLGWLYLALVIPSMAIPGFLLWSGSHRSSRAFRSLVWCGVGMAGAFTGIQAFRAWHMLSENPFYLTSAGARTVYHNAVIGLYQSDALRARLGLPNETSDRGAIDSVNQWLVAHGREPHDPVQLLNALGGHARADWRKYESDAQALYFDTWKQVPSTMLQHYGGCAVAAFCKVRESLARKSILDGPQNKSKTTNPNPFALPWSLLALVPVFVLARFPRAACMILLAACWVFLSSLVPAAAFYVAVHTILGASVMLRFICYLTVSLVIMSLIPVLIKPRPFALGRVCVGVLGVAFLCAILIQHHISMPGK